MDVVRGLFRQRKAVGEGGTFKSAFTQEIILNIYSVLSLRLQQADCVSDWLIRFPLPSTLETPAHGAAINAAQWATLCLQPSVKSRVY